MVVRVLILVGLMVAALAAGTSGLTRSEVIQLIRQYGGLSRYQVIQTIQEHGVGPQGPRGLQGPAGPAGPAGEGINVTLDEWLKIKEEAFVKPEPVSMTGVQGVVHVRSYFDEGGHVGTGFIYKVHDGYAYAATAFHVVSQNEDGDLPKEYHVYRSNARKEHQYIKAEVTYPRDVAKARNVDLAILKFKCANCQALTFSDEELIVDSKFGSENQYDVCVTESRPVVVMGFSDLEEGPTIETGDIQIREDWHDTCDESFRNAPLLMHDAFLNWGDSGSPLLLDGEIVGLNFGLGDDGLGGALYLATSNKPIHNIFRLGWDQ